jgi:ribosome-associated protein
MAKKSRKGYYVKGEFVAEGSEADRQLQAELHDEDAPSRTAQKKASASLQDLGEELIAMSQAVLAGLALPDDLEAAIVAARSITSFGARRRQLQLIGKLMRDVDPEPIREQLAALRGQSAQAAAQQRRLEDWRTRLLDDDDALTAFAQEHPKADLQALRTAIRNARKEQTGAKPPRAYREIFRLLRGALAD